MTETALRKMLEDLVETKIAPLRESQGNILAQLASAPQHVATEPHEKVGFGQFVQALAATKCDPERAHAFAIQAYGKDAPGTMALQKSLGTGLGTAGGVFVPETMSAEVIELLRATAVVRSLNPMMVPMPNGTMTVPKITGGATASYVGEATASNASQATTGSLKLVWKKLQAFVPISNELLQFAAAAAAPAIRDDAVAAIGNREDQAFLRDDGTEDTPKGMRGWTPGANTQGTAADNDGAPPTIAEIETDLAFLVNALKGANVRMIRPSWIISTRSQTGFIKTRDSNGNLAFPEMRTANPTIWSFPVGVSNNIPDNLGAGTDGESEIYLVDMADAVLGESTSMQVELSTEASYLDSGGTLVSAFSRDETVMKITARHDFGMRHDASVAYISGVVLGAN